MLGTMTLAAPIIDSILAEMIETGGPFDPAATWISIGSAVDPHGINTTFANITPVLGSASVPLAVTWGTPYVLDDGSAVVDSTPAVFTPGSTETGSVAVVCLGDSSIGGGAGNLKAFMPEAPPVSISHTQPYTAVIRLVADAAGRYSVSLSWDGF